MAKLVENTFRFVNISFANEMALLCDRLQVNIGEVIGAAASKPFAFMAHQPSAGIGGDCIPVVPFFLTAAARGVGLDLQLVHAAAQIDQAMPRHIVDKLESALAVQGRLPRIRSAIRADSSPKFSWFAPARRDSNLFMKRA